MEYKISSLKNKIRIRYMYVLMVLFVKLLVFVSLKFHITVIHNLCGYNIQPGILSNVWPAKPYLESNRWQPAKRPDDKATTHVTAHNKDNENIHYLRLIFQKRAHFVLSKY